MNVDELRRIPMSPHLAEALARASAYAGEQGHVEVSLEHLLLALTEDPDASQVLTASNIDLSRLAAELSGFLGSIEAHAPEGSSAGLVVGADLKRILEATAAAAMKGRRREINGAIVLAAIVGDGKSSAAHLLRGQGLTFEEAIRVLQRAPGPSGGSGVAPRGGVGGAQSDISRAQHANARAREPGVEALRDPVAAAPPAPSPTLAAASGQWQEREGAFGPAASHAAPSGYVSPQANNRPAFDPTQSRGRGVAPDRAGPVAPVRSPSPVAPRDAAPYRSLPDTGGPTARPGTGQGSMPNPGPNPGPGPGPSYREPPLPPHPVYTPLSDGGRPPGQGAQGQSLPTLTAEDSRAEPWPGDEVEIGDIAENIPRRWTIGQSMGVEVRIGAAVRPAAITALAVRLAAPAGGFLIEPRTPETQWLDPATPQIEDYVSWRWTLTALDPGRQSLTLQTSARALREGLRLAETRLEDQPIEITVAGRSTGLAVLGRLSVFALAVALGIGLASVAPTTLPGWVKTTLARLVGG